MVDKEYVDKLNALTPLEQIDIVMSRAKEHKWNIYLGTLKEKLKDRKNFHILTDNDIMLQRMEYSDSLFNKKVIWSIVKKDTNERVSGNYGTIICKFVEEYVKTHEAICL